MIFCRRGAIVTTFIVCYALTSFISGYVSGGLYSRNGGTIIPLTGLFCLFIWNTLFVFACLFVLSLPVRACEILLRIWLVHSSNHCIVYTGLPTFSNPDLSSYWFPLLMCIAAKFYLIVGLQMMGIRDTVNRLIWLKNMNSWMTGKLQVNGIFALSPNHSGYIILDYWKMGSTFVHCWLDEKAWILGRAIV